MGVVPRGRYSTSISPYSWASLARVRRFGREVGEWLDCDFDYPYTCTNWIEVCARKNAPKDLCNDSKYYDLNDLETSIQVLTADIIEDDWQSAATKVQNAGAATGRNWNRSPPRDDSSQISSRCSRVRVRTDSPAVV